MAAADLADQIAIDDKALLEEFEHRRREFEKPEQRDLKQMLFAGEAEAQAAAAAIAGGKSFDTVVAETPGQSPDRVALGLVARDETLPTIGDAVFGAEAGKVVGPVRTPFGWHVIEIVRIEPGSTANLQDVRAQLEPAVRQRLAAERAFEVANRLEDQVTRGRTLDEAAVNAGAVVVKIAAIDARGRDPSGAPVALFANAPEALRAAFDTAPGRDSQLVETRGGSFFILHVDGTTPAQRRPLDTVKDDVAALWKSERQAEKSLARAREIVAATAAGETLEAAALRFNLRVESVAPVLRTGDAAGTPSAVAARLFAQKPGQASLAAGIDGQFVVRTGDVVPADPAADAAGMAALRTQLTREMAGDMTAEYNQALRQKFGVTVNRSVVDRLN
jgi:peptidyl-prolyl cis-trans isomerase D